MRIFLLIADTIVLIAGLKLFYDGLMSPYSDSGPLMLGALGLVLLVLNIGYINTTRADQSVTKRISRFRQAWKASATHPQEPASGQHESPDGYPAASHPVSDERQR